MLTTPTLTCNHEEEVYFRPRTFLYQQCLECGRVKRSNDDMSIDNEREYNNELTIRTETEEQTDRILEVLQEAEENGELDFGFTCIRDTYPR